MDDSSQQAPASVRTPAFAAPITGPSYGRAYRAGASAVMVLVGVLLVRTADVLLPHWNTPVGWILTSGLIGLVGSYWLLLTARTTVDAEGIRQSGLVENKIAWRDVRSARLRGFGFARRLVLNTGFGKLRAFYAGTPALAAAFERVARTWSRAV